MYFQSDKDKKCDIKVLILLFSPKDHNYLGYIPNEQIQFVDCIRKVIQQQKEQQRVASGSGPGGPAGPQGQPQQQPQSTGGPMMGQQGQGPMMTSQGQVITSIGMGGGGTVTMAPNGIYFMIFYIFSIKRWQNPNSYFPSSQNAQNRCLTNNVCQSFLLCLKVGEKYFLKFNHL